MAWNQIKYPETCFFFVLKPRGHFLWYLQRFEPLHCGRALCVHCTCTVRALSKHTRVPSWGWEHIGLCRSQEWQKKEIERDCGIAADTCLLLCLWIGSVPQRLWRIQKIFLYREILVHIYISVRTYVHTYKLTYIHRYMHTYIHTYVQTYMHMGQAFHAAEQLSQKTRRQDFCRRLMEKILHHQTHLESWPSCSPFNIGRKKRPKSKEVEWLKSCTGAQGLRTQHWTGGAGLEVIPHCQTCPRRSRISSINSTPRRFADSGLCCKDFFTAQAFAECSQQSTKAHKGVPTVGRQACQGASSGKTAASTAQHQGSQGCRREEQADRVCFDSARTVHAQCAPQCTPQCTRRKWCK